MLGEKTGPDSLLGLKIVVNACFSLGGNEKRGIVELDEERAVFWGGREKIRYVEARSLDIEVGV